MTDALQCTVSTTCREPASELTRVCPGHERERRLGELRRSASPGARALSYALTWLLHGREWAPGRAADRAADREAGQ
jgi:hypothetical protein